MIGLWEQQQSVLGYTKATIALNIRNVNEILDITMITKEGTACMDAIDKAWAEYKEVDAKVIEVGATTDTAKSLQAQQMMTDEAAPKYQALDDALQKLMALNISLGNAKRAQLRTVMICMNGMAFRWKKC